MTTEEKTINIAPTWMGLARIAIDDLKRSDLPTREFTITLLENACQTLDQLKLARTVDQEVKQ
tara:strand:+ start:214 stop:402 length:189 start_codon:yes stop_codon:yes gene_type:complete